MDSQDKQKAIKEPIFFSEPPLHPMVSSMFYAENKCQKWKLTQQGED